MAVDTPEACQRAVLYQCFVRQHGPNGTLAEVTADLPRIAALGATVLYLMPIHPIGEVDRKGTLGSPYAIRDYRSIDPALGTEDDFAALVATADRHGLRVMLDVVFNHTAKDSALVAQHPEFFHQDAAGRPVSSVPAWTDVIDLNHDAPGLSDYLIETLQDWVARGVRGFRCDVASLVPLAFWQRARAEVTGDVWWLTESPHPDWVTERNEDGLPTNADSEMFTAFDMAYQYDLWPIWQSAVRGFVGADRFLEMVRWQRATLPPNAVKLRYVENHDNYRIMRFARNPDAALAWTALMAFLPGPFMLYAGQESGADRWPELFERDPIPWGDYRLTDFYQRLTAALAARSGKWRVVASAPVVQLVWSDQDGGLLGLFDLDGVGAAEVDLPDGEYENLYGDAVAVDGGRVALPGPAVILRYRGHREFRHEFSNLLDSFYQVELGDDLDEAKQDQSQP
jgi:glycosidase